MIEIRDVVVDYDGFEAVKGVSFTVKDGEFFTLLGPSGCGKTTTLRAISGFEKVSSGKILLDGKDISPLAPEERKMGFVFQNYALFPSMTVFDNIAFGLSIRHVKKAETKERVHDIASLIGITEHLDKKISQISGGQQQRVAIARALILNPKILLMDEPLSNLDAKLRISMRGEIKRIQKDLGIVAIYVTHDQEEAMAISDKIAVFNGGVIEQIGTPQEVYNHPKTQFAARFVGDINELDSAAVAAVNASSTIPLSGPCFIRTEKVRIVEVFDSSKVCCKGVVVSNEFLGATTKTGIDVGGSVLTAMSFDSHEVRIGSEVYVSFSPSDALFLS